MNIDLSYLLPSDFARVDACARGCYQRALLAGRARWSGADLKGRASKWGAHYAGSRKSLRGRISAIPGIAVRERRGPHGLRVIVIASASVIGAAS